MKTEHKFIAVSIGFGLLFWIVDAVLDYLLFYDRAFWELLISDVPRSELYVRLVMLACFVTFGALVSRVVARRERARQALRIKRDFALKVLNTAGALVVVLDREGRIVRFNRACEQTTGYSSKEVKERLVWDLFLTSQEVEPFKIVFAELLAGQSPNEYENHWVTKDGSHRLIAWSNTVLLSDSGSVEYVISTGIDVTERKRAELALRHNLEERLVTEETLRQRNRELALLHRAGQTLSSTLELDKVLVIVLEEVRRLLNVVACSVWLIDPQTSELVCRQVTDPRSDVVRGWRLAPGQGFAGWVARHGESLIVSDTQADERHFKDVDQQTGLKLRSILSVPLRVRQDVIGVLQVVDERVNRFNTTDLTLLEPLAASAASAIENARLYTVVQQELTERKRAEAERKRLLEAEREQRLLAETLAEVTLALASQIGHEAVLDEVLRQAQRIIPYSTAHIMLLKDDVLRIARWQGYQSYGSEKFISRLAQPLADFALDAEVVQSRKFQVIHDTHQEPRWVSGEDTAWVRSHISVPICLHDRVLGLLRLDGDTPGHFSAEDAKHLEPLANAAAIAIHNAELYRQVQRHAAELEERVAERTHELVKAYEQLKELDRLKSKFVTDVSHELRTPIANLRLYLHLLEHGQPEKHASFLAIIKEQSDRLTDLVQDILNLSRLEVSQENVQFAPVDLNAVVEEVVIAHEPRAAAAGLELSFERSAILTPVWADRNQLTQAVTNLVGNAINYTPSGQVQVTTCLDKGDRQACLQVRDTGMGIEPEDMPHLFERFYRGERVGSLNIPGTGLGLAIVKEIVDLHGGRIEVKSQPNEGSTFRVWLPLEQGKIGNGLALCRGPDDGPVSLLLGEEQA